MAELLDSGERKEFKNGAVRDIQDGKGRCDLLPLVEISDFLADMVLLEISRFMKTGEISHIYEAIRWFIYKVYSGDTSIAILELSKQYEDGAKKYGERNWEKGIPLHCFIDSAIRHYLKYLRYDNDEPHERAVLWNLFGAIWTMDNHGDLIDIEFKKENNFY